MNRNESYPYREQVEAIFRQLGESWAVARNAYDTLTVYLLYRSRFFPLGSPAAVASLSLGALAESIDIAKRHAEFGSATLPSNAMEYQESLPPDIEPPLWLKQLEPSVLPGYIQKHGEWSSTPPVPRYTVPLARMRLPTSVLHQMLQLPDNWSIKQAAMEDGELCVYCLTPECSELDVAAGVLVVQADYQIEERDGRQWRSPVSILVEQAGHAVGGAFYVENHCDATIDL